MFIFHVQCTVPFAIHIPRQELSAVLLHATDQFIRQSFYTIIDGGPIKPQYIRVSGCHNNVVDVIKFRIFVFRWWWL